LSLQLWRQMKKPKDRVLLDELVAMSRTFFASSYSSPTSSSNQQPVLVIV
jgi:hypothetical protein